jgi:thiamine-phosphate pyrophosphorylase
LLLYYITDRSQLADTEDARCRTLLHKIAEAARDGVDFIQLREKDLPTRELEALACACIQVIRENSAPETKGRQLRTRFLINSRVDVAIACGADGVHLRSDDISPREARRIWTSSTGELDRKRKAPLIAASCHTTAEVARAASEGADFVVFAPVFEKRVAGVFSGKGVGALQEACRQNIPVLALGGVTLANARSCVEAGATGVAGIRLFQDGDIANVVRSLRA